MAYCVSISKYHFMRVKIFEIIKYSSLKTGWLAGS